MKRFLSLFFVKLDTFFSFVLGSQDRASGGGSAARGGHPGGALNGGADLIDDVGGGDVIEAGGGGEQPEAGGVGVRSESGGVGVQPEAGGGGVQPEAQPQPPSKIRMEGLRKELGKGLALKDKAKTFRVRTILAND